MSSRERVIVKKKGFVENIEAVLHYDEEGNDLELREGDVALETGSWPLQSYDIVRYLDREDEEHSRKLMAFNDHFIFSVDATTVLTITQSIEGAFSYASSPSDIQRHDRELCVLKNKASDSLGVAEYIFEQVRDPESLLRELISVLGDIVRDQNHAYDLLMDDSSWADLLGEFA